MTSDVAFLEHRVASVEPYGAADAEQIMDGLQDDVDMRVEAHQMDLEAARVLVPWKPLDEKPKRVHTLGHPTHGKNAFGEE